MIDNEYLLDDENEKAPIKKVIKTLDTYVQSLNIAELVKKEDLKEISAHCLRAYDEDLASMRDWLSDADEILEFMDTSGSPKSHPFKNSANIKLPMISTAVLQLSARIQSEMVKNGKAVRHKVVGGDVKVISGPDGNPILSSGLKDRKGKRLTKHLNWQLMDKIPNYSNECRKLYTAVASFGTAFTKTYYDPVLGSIRSEFVPYDQIIVNNAISSLETAEVITHKIYKSTKEIVECQRFGYYSELEDDYGNELQVKDLTKDPQDYKATKHLIYEQHCWLDLDEDGLPEPYIVTIHVASKKVLGIAARFEPSGVIFNNKNQIKQILPIHYFTDFHGPVAPDGGFWSRGLGHLLLNLNDAANAMINILTNAGNLATMQGGFLDKNLRIKKGLHEMQPGEWISADSSGASLKDGIVPFSYKEPSNVLFQVLGLLLEQSKAVSATSDLLSGQNSDSLSNVSPNVVFSLMEQGLQVYSYITRGIAGGKKKEINKIVNLNAIYVDPQEYLALVSPEPSELEEMFGKDGRLIDYDVNALELQVVPVVDVNEATESEKQIRSQAIFQAALQSAPFGASNVKYAFNQLVESMGAENVNAYMAPEMPPQPDPIMIEAQQQAQLEQAKLQIEMQKLELEKVKIQLDYQISQAELQSKLQNQQIQIGTIQSQTALSAKRLELDEAKVQLDIHKAALSERTTKAKMTLDHTLKQREFDIKDRIINKSNSDE